MPRLIQQHPFTLAWSASLGAAAVVMELAQTYAG